MRIETFDGIAYGGNSRANFASKGRKRDLEEEGYVVYAKRNEVGLNKVAIYYLFVLDRQEESDLIQPFNPGHSPLGRRLNVRTAHVGMRIAVETLPDECHPLHGFRGTIKGVKLTPEGLALARITLDVWVDRHEEEIRVENLRQVAE